MHISQVIYTYKSTSFTIFLIYIPEPVLSPVPIKKKEAWLGDETPALR